MPYTTEIGTSKRVKLGASMADSSQMKGIELIEGNICLWLTPCVK